MSTLPDSDFDLEKLFLPAWAQEDSSSAKYAKYEGEPERVDRGERRHGRRPLRGDRPMGARPPGNRRPGEGGRPQGGGPRRDQPGADRKGGPARGRGPRDRRQERPHREPPPPLPQVNISLVPEDKGVESLARQIKMTGRAYPLFDIAQMILQKPERHLAVFSVKKNEQAQPIQPLFVCALDDSLWLSEDEAVAHILRKHFATFYQAERTATEPPKGKYTFVAQCGMSGVILGPPNHHDYQNQLRKLHSERFSRMPFEVYKSRVRIVRDEEIVKKWVDDQSWKTEYICLNMPEPLKLGTMEAVEKHFRETHKENIVKTVDSHTMTGAAARNLRCQELQRLFRVATEEQRRFPLQIATVLSQQFASHGLQFFKVNKTITHVAVARPHYLDLALIPVSEGVKRIVEYINANPKCSRRQLVETLAPTPVPAVIPVSPPPAEAQQQAATPPAPAEPEGPTPEQTAVISDLHWLIHQGHVIEFANGTLETAKKPVPKPPKPEKQRPKEEPAAADAAAAVTVAGTNGAEPVAAAEAAGESLPLAPETPASAGLEGAPPEVEQAATAEPPAGSDAPASDASAQQKLSAETPASVQEPVIPAATPDSEVPTAEIGEPAPELK